MKTTALVVLSLIVTVISHPSLGATCPRQDSPPKASLVVDKQEYPIAESADVIKKAFSKIDAKKADNIIVYIHGRGKEPEKSEQEIIPPLQKEYTASVIMFHWCPSWTGPLGFPDENAKAAADEFAKFVTALKNFQGRNQLYANIPVTLLSHSMGAFVLEEFSSRGFGPLPSASFDTVVLSAPAVKADNHAAWLNKLDGGNYIYVAFNKNDPILSKLAKERKEGRLGQKLETMMGRKFELANQVKYIDVTKTGVGHRYIIKAGQKNNRMLKEFFQAVLNGKPADLSGATVEHKQIYILK